MKYFHNNILIKNLYFCSLIKLIYFEYTFIHSSAFSLLRNIPTPVHGILIILDRACFSVESVPNFQKIDKQKKIVKFTFKFIRIIFSVKFLMTASVKMSLVLTRELSLHNLLEIVISTIYNKVHQNCWESLEIIKEVGTNLNE